MRNKLKRSISMIIVMTMIAMLFPGFNIPVQASSSGIEKTETTGFYWPNFRGNDENNGVVDFKTPRTADEAELYWAVKKGSGFGGAAIGTPIIVDDYLVFTSGKNLFKQNRYTGEILYDVVGTLAGTSAFNIVPPTYGDGMIFVTLTMGIIQAFDADTLESLWIYKDPLGIQGNTAITYHNGYVYTGFTRGESKDANFVCVDVTDEDPENPLEEKTATWTYTQKGGFYWASAYVNDDFVLVGTDDGEGGYSSQTSNLLSLDPLTGQELDKIEGLDGDIRSSVAYDNGSEGTGRFYFTSKGGSFYSVAVNEDGTFPLDANFTEEVSETVTTRSGVKGYDLKQLKFKAMDGTGSMLTSTPAINNGRAYVGIGGSNQFGVYSGHCINVIDLESFTLAYQARTKGYPQTSGLITTAYENDEDDGYNYVYFNENYGPGVIRVIKDKKGVTSLIGAVTETDGSNTYTDCAPALFTPVGAQAQFSLASAIADPEGTLYFKNDSAHMMAVGSRITSIEVTNQPQKAVYEVGSSFDKEGMKVVAHLTNGLTRDISEYVTFTSEPLTTSDTDITLTYSGVMYHDTTNAPNANTTGVESLPLETTVNISVIPEADYGAVKNVEDLIDAIGTVSLDSEKAINTARTAYDALDEALQNLVSNYTTLVDAETALAQLIEEGQALEEAKVQAKEDLAIYKNAEDYREAEQAERTAAINAGKEAIDAATSIEDVDQALANAKLEIDHIKTDADYKAEEEAQALAQAKEEAKEVLDVYKNAEDYREAQKAELAAAIDIGKEAIDAATSIEDVEQALADAKSDIDAIKTNDQLTAEEEQGLEEVKAQAKTELEGFKDPKDYREAQQEELTAAIAAGKEAIDEATDAGEVADALSAAKTAIREIKTDVQLTQEEKAQALAEAKSEAKEELETYKKAKDYRKAQQAELTAAINAGKDAIDKAKSIEDVNQALSNAKSNIDIIKTDAALSEEEEAVLKKAKEDAIKELEEYKDLADYREEEKSQISAVIAAAKKSIEAAEDLEAVAAAKTEAKTAMDAVKTDAQLLEEEKDKDKGKDTKKGQDQDKDKGQGKDTDNGQGKGKGGGKTSSAKTGDDTPIMAVGITLIASITLLLGILIKKQRRA